MSRRKLKGPKKALRTRPLRERRHVSLDRTTEEMLFRHAEVMAEGSVRDGVWYGSTMITFDLGEVEKGLRKPLDAETKAQLSAAVAGSVRVRIRAMRMALDEVARRCPGEALGTATMETQVTLKNGSLLLDVDLEVPLSVSSVRGR